MAAGGKAVTLASGEVLADDPSFYARQFEILATLTSGSVQAAMQRWMTRPFDLVLEPGERDGSHARKPWALRRPLATAIPPKR